MKILLISLFAICAFAGRVCLPKGWIFEWTIFRDNEIGFKLTLDEYTCKHYGWVGIGLKLSSEAVGMINSDIANLIFNGEKTDRFAYTNGMPALDTDLGGTEDLLNPTESEENGLFVFSWTKKLNTGDEYDAVYIEGESYNLLWACGDMHDGVQLKHFTVDRDRTIITLSQDYDSGCEEIDSSFIQIN